jgi:hypothetical protein
MRREGTHRMERAMKSGCMGKGMSYMARFARLLLLLCLY